MIGFGCELGDPQTSVAHSLRVSVRRYLGVPMVGGF